MRYSEFTAMDRVRVSCLSFARIRHPDQSNRYGLLLNQGHMANFNTRVLSPVGGSLEVKPAGRLKLPEGCEFESRRSPNDLRITLPGKHVGQIVSWFASRNAQERETDVARELHEELGPDEDGPLAPRQLQGVRTSFAGFYATILETRKPEAKVKQTLYLTEVYDARIPKGISRLAEIDGQPDSPFHFLPESHIRQGRSELPNTHVGALCVAVVSPKPRLQIS